MSIQWIFDATHYDRRMALFYKKEGGVWYIVFSDGDVQKSTSMYNGELKESDLIERQKQPQAWSGPEDGLPPVGEEIEIKIDFKRAPPYAIITLTELGVDVQKHTPRFQKAKVLYSSSKYLVTESQGIECLAPMSCVEIRAIKTPEQLAAEERERAVSEMIEILEEDMRVHSSDAARRLNAEALYDAGFKREVK